ncbi:Matrilysin, partial [Gonioctena quinquepunctata]
VANWSPKLSEASVARNIQKALDEWGGYGRLYFQRAYTPDADIIVAFGSGFHGDVFPFDGPGHTLAHAFFPSQQDPLGGDIHFDDDEYWVDDNSKNEGTDFYAVALHELGHSLGLAHSPVESSVMFPYYKAPDSGAPHLDYDDIMGMYELYISRYLDEDKQTTPRQSPRKATTTTASPTQSPRKATTTTASPTFTTRRTTVTQKRSRPTTPYTPHPTTPSTLSRNEPWSWQRMGPPCYRENHLYHHLRRRL